MSTDTGQHDADSALVERSRQGDREAFASLYDRYARLIRAVAYDRFPSLAASHDITQETFLRAWQKLPTLRQPESFGAWLVGIARQICREQRRSTRRERQVTFTDNLPEPTTNDCPETQQLAGERTRILLQSIAELSERERLAVHAFYLQERDIEQVTRLLQLSRSGTYALLKRACQSLSHKLLAPDREIHR
jgi:RNA polymerase sigma-70 factor (ECF subfamily)